jgi:hypothetical protein
VVNATIRAGIVLVSGEVVGNILGGDAWSYGVAPE